MSLFVGLGTLFLSLAAVTGAVGLWAAKKRRTLACTGVWVDGRIIAKDDDPDSDGLTVEFTDGQGRVFQTRSRGSSSGWPEVGSPTRILYDPTHPERNELELDHQLTRWLVPLLCLVFGLIGGGLLASGLLP